MTDSINIKKELAEAANMAEERPDTAILILKRVLKELKRKSDSKHEEWISEALGSNTLKGLTF